MAFLGWERVYLDWGRFLMLMIEWRVVPVMRRLVLNISSFWITLNNSITDSIYRFSKIALAPLTMIYVSLFIVSRTTPWEPQRHSRPLPLFCIFSQAGTHLLSEVRTTWLLMKPLRNLMLGHFNWLHIQLESTAIISWWSLTDILKSSFML